MAGLGRVRAAGLVGVGDGVAGVVGRLGQQVSVAGAVVTFAVTLVAALV